MSATPQEYRSIVPIEGYVHKFRLEAREEASARDLESALATPTVNLGALLGRFVIVTVVLTGIAAAGARILL